VKMAWARPSDRVTRSSAVAWVASNGAAADGVPVPGAAAGEPGAAGWPAAGVCAETGVCDGSGVCDDFAVLGGGVAGLGGGNSQNQAPMTIMERRKARSSRRLSTEN